MTTRLISTLCALLLLAAASPPREAGRAGVRRAALQQRPLSAAGSAQPTVSSDTVIDYREAMRDFVEAISAYSKRVRPGFAIVPQNALELLSRNGDPRGRLDPPYVRAIDGVLRESVFFGQPEQDEATIPEAQVYALAWLQTARRAKLPVFVIDYCARAARVRASYRANERRGHIAYAAPARELDRIPADPPRHENRRDIARLAEAANFLHLINPHQYADRATFLAALRRTNYDVVVVDLFFNQDGPLTREEVASLRRKANGGKRLILCYLSIGEAENYRPYWDTAWSRSQPPWLERENPDWPGNFKVRYWIPEWQRLILGREQALLDQILARGFDGVYLDVVDAWQYFEDLRETRR